MYALKPISRKSVTGALAKAERYRLLNEPTEAESICRDILDVDPANREARISLVLALTDEFSQDEKAFARAVAEIAGLESAYDRAYYSGIAWERRAKASRDSRRLGSSGHVYEWIVKALGLFEEAERLRPAGNDDPILRWNACVRFLERHKTLGPRTEDVKEPILSE
jgi:tetratricopeptide (TPR) repeat protein